MPAPRAASKAWLTPMIGRDAELAALEQAIDGLRTGPRRLSPRSSATPASARAACCAELERRARRRADAAIVVHGRAARRARSGRIALLRDIVARRLRCIDGDSMATAREKIERGVADVLAGEGAEA
jgi:hypothetical protein